MIEKRKGFTLVELIVVLVILGILLTLVIPNLTGWIDRAKEKRLAASCRECVVAAQTLAIEAYTKNGSTTPPESADIIELAGIKGGTASNISLDDATKSVNTLTYSEDEESVTYYRLPSPQYVSGTGIAKEMAAAYNWAQEYKYATSDMKKEHLTKDYGNADPSPISEAQKKLIFGNLRLEKETQYIYPMAFFDASGKPLNIQYVTPQNPNAANTSGQNRYQAAAFIIDGKTYISNLTKGDKVRALAVATKDNETFQQLMNSQTFRSTKEFVEYITGSNGYFELAK